MERQISRATYRLSAGVHKHLDLSHVFSLLKRCYVFELLLDTSEVAATQIIALGMFDLHHRQCDGSMAILFGFGHVVNATKTTTK